MSRSDAAHLEAFVANQAFLRRLARELVGDPARAEDLVQDTWLVWSRKAPGHVSAPRAWLARALRWRAGNERREVERRFRRERTAARTEGTRPEGDPGDVLGTLDVQASVVAALRALDEPYRSTLVQRYFHDWTPTRIAAEGGVPLNTVKARLARGLQRLREELDRRHGGDRKAWCHLLWTALGRGGAEWSLVGSLTALAVAVARMGLRAVTAFSSLGTWLALTGVLAAAFFAWMRWPRTENELVAAQPPVTREPRAAPALVADGRQPASIAPTKKEVRLKEPAAAAEPELLPFVNDPLPFSWPQFGGTAAHDALALRARGDLIERPAVLWEAGSRLGQPTIDGVELFSGGTVLFRHSVASNRRDLKTAFPSQKDGFGAAPAITDTLVLARVTRSGGLTAFDRTGLEEQWTWEPEEPVAVACPPCLVEDLVILALDRDVVALRTFDGSVAWSTEVPESGHVRATPASSGGLLFLGTDRGQVVALDWATGVRVWTLQVEAELGGTSPVCDGDLVYLTGAASDDPLARADLWAVDIAGSVAWRTKGRFPAPLSMAGVGTDTVWVVAPSGVAAFDREDGDELWAAEDPLFELRARRTLHRAAPQPQPIGNRVYVGLDDQLLALDQGTGERLHAYRLPEGERVVDFVHAGDRLYLASDKALRAIGEDPEAEPFESGGVFDLDPERRAEARLDALQAPGVDRATLERGIRELLREQRRRKER